MYKRQAWDFKPDEKGMTYPEQLPEIPAEFAEEAALRHQELLDAAADCDDELMEKVLMDEEVSVEELKLSLIHILPKTGREPTPRF